jgi:hypothetical protein
MRKVSDEQIPASSTKQAYMKHSLFNLIMRSVRQMVGSGCGGFKDGDYVGSFGGGGVGKSTSEGR